MLTVTDLLIYPIKSLGGIALNAANVTDRGLEYDRRWMLVDENNCFLTQRDYPVMALLQVGLDGKGLTVQHKGGGEIINIPFDTQPGETAIAQIFDDNCKVEFTSPRIDEYFSDMLQTKCRLAYMPADSKRMVEELYALNNDITSLSDGYPVLTISQESLADLNSRLTEPLPMNRFRPNIVFSGGQAYEEDTLEHFTIGNVHFYGVKLCGRCVITTINQTNGSSGKEPLKTMATYRFKNKKIYFGQNLLLSGEGRIQVGDVMQVIKTKPGFLPGGVS